MRKNPSRTVGFAAIAAVVGALLVAAPAANAAEDADTLIAALGDPIHTTEADGTTLLETSRTEEVGETVATGVTSSGEAYEVISVFGPASSLEEVEPPAPATTPQPGAAAPTADVPEGEGVLEIGVAEVDPDAVDVEQFVPIATIARTSEAVSVAWADRPDTVEYRVHAGEVVESTATNEFAASYAEIGQEATAIQIDALDSEGAILQTNIIPLEDLDTSIQPMGYQQYTTAFTYETFIPQARVGVTWMEAGACGGWPWEAVEFGGDNRTWRTPGATWPYDNPDYRTMAMTVVNWSNTPQYSLINGRGVGPTRMYVNGALSSTRTASTNGIVDTSQFREGNYAQVVWTHNVGNPHCAAGTILYQVTVGFYRSSGLIQVVGYRRPVPNHELYGRWNTGSTETWYTIARRSNSGFHCLTGVCGNETINLQVTH